MAGRWLAQSSAAGAVAEARMPAAASAASRACRPPLGIGSPGAAWAAAAGSSAAQPSALAATALTSTFIVNPRGGAAATAPDTGRTGQAHYMRLLPETTNPRPAR